MFVMSVTGKGARAIAALVTSGKFAEEVVFYSAAMRKEGFARIACCP